jgi:hypothetical protein
LDCSFGGLFGFIRTKRRNVRAPRIAELDIIVEMPDIAIMEIKLMEALA